MDIKKQFEDMMDTYYQLKELIRRHDKHLYERWKAGGFIVDNDIISMYPNMENAIDSMATEENLEDEELDDEES